MPVRVIVRRPKPSLVIAGPTAPALAEPPTFSYPVPLTKTFAVWPVLRVGEYEVGETFCPRLCGHPGIRY